MNSYFLDPLYTVYLKLFLMCLQVIVQRDQGPKEYRTDCSKLLPGQFLCLDLNIDPKTQQPRDCHKELLLANVTCEAAPGIICSETNNSTFTGSIPCK